MCAKLSKAHTFLKLSLKDLKHSQMNWKTLTKILILILVPGAIVIHLLIKGLKDYDKMHTNNPGNISKTKNLWRDEVATPSGRFKSFKSLDAGIGAIFYQVYTDAKRGHTIRSFIHKYAPPTENKTEAYVNYLSHETRKPDNTLLTNMSEGNLIDLVKAITKMETGNIYTHDQIHKGLLFYKERYV